MMIFNCKETESFGYVGRLDSSEVLYNESILKHEYLVLILDSGFEGEELGICLFSHSKLFSVYLSYRTKDEVFFAPLATNNKLIPVKGCVFSLYASELEYKVVENLGVLSEKTLQKALTMIRLSS